MLYSIKVQSKIHRNPTINISTHRHRTTNTNKNINRNIPTRIYSYNYLFFTESNCQLDRFSNKLLHLYTIIITSISPTEIANEIVIVLYYYNTILLYLPLFHRLKLTIRSL